MILSAGLLVVAAAAARARVVGLTVGAPSTAARAPVRRRVGLRAFLLEII